MRLDFNILWVEDQRSLVESTRELIEIMIRREGFRLKVEFADSIEQAKAYLSNDIYGDHIDLILMDYDLGAGGKGDDGLVEVRNLFEYKDVIFYSADAPDLKRMVAEKELQGIFCSTRDTLHDTVHGVFDALMKKVLDIDHSRGIVMGATSDIDYYVLHCLNSSFDNGENEHKSHALEIVGRHMKERERSFAKDVGKIAAIKHIAELEDLHHTYTSNDRLRLLKSLVEKSGENLDTIDPIKGYLDQTVRMRNDLAHVRVETNGFSRKLFDRKGNELTSEQMKTLRLALLEFQELVEDLSASTLARCFAIIMPIASAISGGTAFAT
jgi:CheY-like chemotaxis protein